MVINEDPFPLVASINTVNFNLRALIESKKAGKLSSRKVWVPKYCLVRVDKLKKEWPVVCTGLSSGRNSVKGIQQKIEQHDLFSKERRFSLKGKMNSPGDRFVPLIEMAIEQSTPPRGKFIALRENYVGKFKECSSRNRASFPKKKKNYIPPNFNYAFSLRAVRKQRIETPFYDTFCLISLRRNDSK